MGFTCSVLESSLAELKQDGVIEEYTRVIKEPYTFLNYNKTKTKIVNDVYKVNTKGQLLYNEVVTKSNNYIAEPNQWIFDEVQKVKDQLEIKTAVLAKTPENLDKSSGVKHFILTTEVSNESTGLSTKNFLNTKTDVETFEVLQNLFFTKLGKVYRPYAKTKAAKADKNTFYKFLASKGYVGLVIDEKFAVSFEFDSTEAIDFINKMEVENSEPQLQIFDESLEPTAPLLNKVEVLGTYSAEEVALLKESYSDLEINEMMISDPQEAKAIFNELLFNKLWEKSNFAPKELINNFNRICR